MARELRNLFKDFRIEGNEVVKEDHSYGDLRAGATCDSVAEVKRWLKGR